ASDVHFVTRLKTNAAFVVVESRPVAAGSAVRSDEVVVFTQHATDDNDRFSRRIVYWDEQQQREFEFLTNHLTLDAALVAAVYRQRWQIELLFRALNQNLKIKTFVGTSANALKIQIWTALIRPPDRPLLAIAEPAPMAPQPLRGAAASSTLCLPRLMAIPRHVCAPAQSALRPPSIIHRVRHHMSARIRHRTQLIRKEIPITEWIRHPSRRLRVTRHPSQRVVSPITLNPAVWRHQRMQTTEFAHLTQLLRTTLLVLDAPATKKCVFMRLGQFRPFYCRI
ncbi:MAG: transposase, partial [Bryobacterales bacterium]|nr:transposase [Bryobacterales bacterium]